MNEASPETVKKVLVALVGEEKYKETESILHQMEDQLTRLAELVRENKVLEERNAKLCEEVLTLKNNNEALRKRLGTEASVAISGEQALIKIKRIVEIYEQRTESTL